MVSGNIFHIEREQSMCRTTNTGGLCLVLSFTALRERDNTWRLLEELQTSVGAGVGLCGSKASHDCLLTLGHWDCHNWPGQITTNTEGTQTSYLSRVMSGFSVRTQ